MRHAYLIASKSKDPRTQIGAVIVQNNEIVSSGYNGFPRKVVDSADRYSDRDFKNAIVRHAEENACFNACRSGRGILNTTLYTQGFPCHRCLGAIVQCGLKEVVIHSQFGQLENAFWSKNFHYSKLQLEESGIFLRVFDKQLNLGILKEGKWLYV